MEMGKERDCVKVMFTDGKRKRKKEKKRYIIKNDTQSVVTGRSSKFEKWVKRKLILKVKKSI